MKNNFPQVSFAPCSCHSHIPDLTRRRFISSAIGLGIGTVGAMSGCASILTPSAQENTGLIDVHHHFIPPFYLAEYRDKIATSRGGQITPAWLNWSPEKAIHAMDAANVATAVLSLSSPGVWFGDSDAATRTARRVNEYAAELVKTYKGRFGFFAAVPLPNQEACLREVEYAFDVLGADGIGLLTSYGDKWVGNPAYEPVFAELNRRKSVVFVHPTAPSCCRSLLLDIPTVIAEVPQDTARAITNLLVTGTFSRFRDIKFIFTHAGGNMPMILGRIKQYGPASLKTLAPNGLEYELSRHYYDLAGTANRPAVSAITSIVPSTQILLGSDNPYIPLAETAEDIKTLGFSVADLQLIRRGNALSLIPSLAIR